MTKRFHNFALRMDKEGYNIKNLGSLLHYIANVPKGDVLAFRAIENALDSICEQTDKLFCPTEVIEQYFPHLIEALFERKGEKYTEHFLSTLSILFDGTVKIDTLNEWKARRLKEAVFLPRAMSLVMSLEKDAEMQNELIDFFSEYDGYKDTFEKLRQKPTPLDLSAQSVREETGVNIAEVIEHTNVIHFKPKAQQTSIPA